MSDRGHLNTSMDTSSYISGLHQHLVMDNSGYISLSTVLGFSHGN